MSGSSPSKRWTAPSSWTTTSSSATVVSSAAITSLPGPRDVAARHQAGPTSGPQNRHAGVGRRPCPARRGRRGLRPGISIAATIAATSSSVGVVGCTSRDRAARRSSQRHVPVLALRQLLALGAQHVEAGDELDCVSRPDRSRRRRSRARPRRTGWRTSRCTRRRARPGGRPGRRPAAARGGRGSRPRPAAPSPRARRDGHAKARSAPIDLEFMTT